MSFRDKVQDWIDKGFTPAPNPLVSKRLVLKNLNQIKKLLEEDAPYIATERWLEQLGARLETSC